MQIGVNRSPLAQGEGAAAGTPALGFHETSYLRSPIPPLAQTQRIIYKLQVGATSREASSTLSPAPTSSLRLLSSPLGRAAGRSHSAESVMGKKRSVTA